VNCVKPGNPIPREGVGIPNTTTATSQRPSIQTAAGGSTVVTPPTTTGEPAPSTSRGPVKRPAENGENGSKYGKIPRFRKRSFSGNSLFLAVFTVTVQILIILEV
jgi:hypothetical protein